MSKQWEKLGLIFSPSQNYPWMQTHAGNPTVEPLGGSIFRVYFSSRDSKGRASVTYLELDINAPRNVLKLADRPLITLGQRGAFDDSGISIGSFVKVGQKRYIYYLGWYLGVTVPFTNTIGLAVAEDDNLIFQRVSEAPIMDRCKVDPLSLSYPWVMKEGDIWRMWYGSHKRWGEQFGDMIHAFKYAESSDGIHWERDGKIIIDVDFPRECALSRPMVIKEKGLYKMWFSYRDKTYRIGYAESQDAKNWKRMDEKAGLDVSKEGWDSESVAYPCIFDHAGTRYMLYNGNNYGKAGMGLAVWRGNE